MATSDDDPIIVDFPLRGEWMAFNSPGDQVPSHGTDMLGQRFAFDFVRTDRRDGVYLHPAGRLRSNLIGFPIAKCYGWGQPIHMPFDGEIVSAADGYPERSRIVPFREIAVVIKNGLTFDIKRSDLRRLTGNFVVARRDDVFAGFGHLTTGSVQVTNGQRVVTGDVIGRVGHTGNSTAPHLHFQLMDGPDIRTAAGLPCAFAAYEIERDGVWERVEAGIPRRWERIRSISPG